MVAPLAITAGLAIALGSFVTALARVALPPITTPEATWAAPPPAARRPWRLVGGRHWQIESTAAEAVSVTDAAEGTRGRCPEGMVEASGNMKLDPSEKGHLDGQSVEEMQKTTCTKWINRDYPERCGVFDRDKWLALSAGLKTKPMHFCIDRFEFPNQKGAFPLVLATYPEAKNACAAVGKRLCDEREWTFACEGEEATPYPYGYVRDAQACVVDQPWRAFNEGALRPRDGQNAKVELDRLWQGVASGARPKCKSPFGVYDMTGNIDEWVRGVRPGERPSILKGGYWGPVRTRCRPSTRSHDEKHAFYQQGFRCCSDVPEQALTTDGRLADPNYAPLPREAL